MRGLKAPWQPGQSGNPGGRHKLTEAQKLCRELTPDAVATLKANLASKNGQVSNMAAKILLEHAWGRPPVMSEDGNALAEQIREMMVSEVRMVIVRPEDRNAAEEPSRA
jgi:hypothetical protein